MNDRDVALTLASIQQQIQDLHTRMTDSGYSPDSLGATTVESLLDTVDDAKLEFAQSGECERELFPHLFES